MYRFLKSSVDHSSLSTLPKYLCFTLNDLPVVGAGAGLV